MSISSGNRTLFQPPPDKNVQRGSENRPTRRREANERRTSEASIGSVLSGQSLTVSQMSNVPEIPTTRTSFTDTHVPFIQCFSLRMAFGMKISLWEFKNGYFNSPENFSAIDLLTLSQRLKKSYDSSENVAKPEKNKLMGELATKLAELIRAKEEKLGKSDAILRKEILDNFTAVESLSSKKTYVHNGVKKLCADLRGSQSASDLQGTSDLQEDVHLNTTEVLNLVGAPAPLNPSQDDLALPDTPSQTELTSTDPDTHSLGASSNIESADSGILNVLPPAPIEATTETALLPPEEQAAGIASGLETQTAPLSSSPTLSQKSLNVPGSSQGAQGPELSRSDSNAALTAADAKARYPSDEHPLGSSLIADFMLGSIKNVHGITRRDMMHYSPEKLTQPDNFYFLFPTDTPNRRAVEAPVLDKNTIVLFGAYKNLRKKQHAALKNVLPAFQLNNTSTSKSHAINKNSDFETNPPEWLKNKHPSQWQITQMIRSLHLLGHTKLASNLQTLVITEGEKIHIDPEVIRAWKKASPLPATASPVQANKYGNNEIANFIAGFEPNRTGITFADFQQFTPDQLEDMHHFIQYVFPTDEQSKIELQAPLLNQETINHFKCKDLREQHFAAYQHMMPSLGFERLESGHLGKCATFEEDPPTWLKKGNHNQLRITRMIRSMHLLGNKKDSLELQALVLEIGKKYEIEGKVLHYWEKATEGKLKTQTAPPPPPPLPLPGRAQTTLKFSVSGQGENRKIGRVGRKAAPLVVDAKKITPFRSNRYGSNVIANFMAGLEPNKDNVFVSDMLGYSDFKQINNAVPFLFPIETDSTEAPEAHLLDTETIELFQGAHDLREIQHFALKVALKPLGLSNSNANSIQKAMNFGTSSPNWVKGDEKAQQRITRMIQSMHLLGNDELARNLQTFVIAVGNDNGIDPEVIDSWKNATIDSGDWECPETRV